jgi:hypothetical protein
MPDDNSCLFRAFATAVLPTGDDLSMPELRALVAGAIQEDPEVYTKAVLDLQPDEYCRWIQSPDAWGGAIEMGILSQHFDIEICSIDVQVGLFYGLEPGSDLNSLFESTNSTKEYLLAAYLYTLEYTMIRLYKVLLNHLIQKLIALRSSIKEFGTLTTMTSYYKHKVCAKNCRRDTTLLILEA